MGWGCIVLLWIDLIGDRDRDRVVSDVVDIRGKGRLERHVDCYI